jgi:hypothetical protein
MCHRLSAGGAWQCGCGYEFGQSMQCLLVLLRDQQTSAWLTLALLLLLDAAAGWGAVLAALHGFIVLAALGFTALVLLTARTVHRLLLTRASLRHLTRRASVLPRAVVHRR